MRSVGFRNDCRAAFVTSAEAGVPQPFAEPGEQRCEWDWGAQSVRGADEELNEKEQLDAAREWLRHVVAGRWLPDAPSL